LLQSSVVIKYARLAARRIRPIVRARDFGSRRTGQLGCIEPNPCTFTASPKSALHDADSMMRRAIVRAPASAARRKIVEYAPSLF